MKAWRGPEKERQRRIQHAEQKATSLSKCLIIEVKSDKGFNYREQGDRLRRFLHARLNLTKISKKEMAYKLDISRQTLNKWEKEWEQKKR